MIWLKVIGIICAVYLCVLCVLGVICYALFRKP
jgi:hypothetical protein